MTNKILLIDDDRKLIELLIKFMKAEGFITKTAFNGSEGLSLAAAFDPDVVVLDIMMPGLDGLELLQRLRQFSNAYVIMLTARAEEADKVLGLSLGSDDYMVKPFSPRELIARIKAAIRRLDKNVNKTTEIRAPGIRLIPGSREVYVDEKELVLTKTEFDLLQALMRNSGIVMTREKLLQEIWGYDYVGDSRAVDVAISSLRKKIGDADYIETVHGIGYKFQKEIP